MRAKTEIEREWARVAAAVKSATVARNTRHYAYACGALRTLSWLLGIRDESPADVIAAGIEHEQSTSHARLVR